MASRDLLPPTGGAKNWRELYTAALFETDRVKLAARIEEAEIALLARGRELFVARENSDEAEDLDHALYAIRALRNCLKFGTNGPQLRDG